MIYEPATSEQLQNLKQNLRLADLGKRTAQEQAGVRDSSNDEDTAFMIIFGGKNAESDVLFNDIYFLSIP